MHSLSHSLLRIPGPRPQQGPAQVGPKKAFHRLNRPVTPRRRQTAYESAHRQPARHGDARHDLYEIYFHRTGKWSQQRRTEQDCYHQDSQGGRMSKWTLRNAIHPRVENHIFGGGWSDRHSWPPPPTFQYARLSYTRIPPKIRTSAWGAH